jgi:hypothetical protein
MLYICKPKKNFYYICTITFKKYIMDKRDFINGLYVEGGRLINDRPDSMSGIAKAASIKRSVMNDRKVNQIAEGMQLADRRKNFRELDF